MENYKNESENNVNEEITYDGQPAYEVSTDDVPVVELPKKPFYKKMGFWAVIVIILGIAAGLVFGDYGVKSEFIKYNNEQIMPLAKEFVEIDSELGKYTKAENADDEEVYMGIKENIIPKIEQLREKSEKISPKNEEVKAVHQLYMNSLSKFYESMVMLAEAFEKKDEESLEKATEIYKACIDEFEKFVEKRDEFIEKYNLEVEDGE